MAQWWEVTKCATTAFAAITFAKLAHTFFWSFIPGMSVIYGMLQAIGVAWQLALSLIAVLATIYGQCIQEKELPQAEELNMLDLLAVPNGMEDEKVRAHAVRQYTRQFRSLTVHASGCQLTDGSFCICVRVANKWGHACAMCHAVMLHSFNGISCIAHHHGQPASRMSEACSLVAGTAEGLAAADHPVAGSRCNHALHCADTVKQAEMTASTGRQCHVSGPTPGCACSLPILAAFLLQVKLY